MTARSAPRCDILAEYAVLFSPWTAQDGQIYDEYNFTFKVTGIG